MLVITISSRETFSWIIFQEVLRHYDARRFGLLGGGEGFPSKSGNAAQTKGCLLPVSLNLFTGRPLLRATVAISEKKTIFGRRVSSIRTTGPIHRSCAFMMRASMPNMLALRRNAHDLASATEVKLIECYNDFCRASKSHSHRAEKR